MTVLLLVAVMSAVAVAILDDIRFGIRRTQNLRNVGQAQWYALGAETMAREQVRRLHASSPGRTALDNDWVRRRLTLPTGEGGVVTAELDDGGNCFNLNSVVEGRGEFLVRRDRGVAQFVMLLEQLGTTPARAVVLADALADWIDSNGNAYGQGGEDEAYIALGYRTGGTLLSEVSELRAVRGYDPAVYARIRSYVCALPTSELTRLNPNTLGPERAVLLAAILDMKISPAQARAVLSARPRGGWRDLEAVERQLGPVATGLVPEQLSLLGRYFNLTVRATHGDSVVMMSALLERDERGEVHTVSRRWSPDR